MDYTLESRDECEYCGGTARCDDCGGNGEDGDIGNEGPCPTCEGAGVCTECIDGVAQYLVRGDRWSRLNHKEAWLFESAGIIPDWFEKFHDDKAAGLV